MVITFLNVLNKITHVYGHRSSDEEELRVKTAAAFPTKPRPTSRKTFFELCLCWILTLIAVPTLNNTLDVHFFMQPAFIFDHTFILPHPYSSQIAKFNGNVMILKYFAVYLCDFKR